MTKKRRARRWSSLARTVAFQATNPGSNPGRRTIRNLQRPSKGASLCLRMETTLGLINPSYHKWNNAITSTVLNLIKPKWAGSSAGRVPAWRAGGPGFKSRPVHYKEPPPGSLSSSWNPAAPYQPPATIEGSHTLPYHPFRTMDSSGSREWRGGLKPTTP